MKPIFVYPGCFTPPTFGHFRIAQKAAEIFPEVTIVCSTNDAKSATRWFSEEECKAMWQHYDMPKNVSVETFAEYSAKKVDFKNLVMIRGIRDENDMENEKRVMKLNKDKYGIDKIFYILAEEAFKDISASKGRQAAQELDFQTLSACFPPPIISILLEKVLAAKNVFMVVGRPGSGKSTFLKMVAATDETCVHIDTDRFSKIIRPLIHAHFGKDVDLVRLAVERDQELTAIIAPAWFGLLKDALREVPRDKHIFIEVPYGLRPGKDMHRFIGGKIIYIGCDRRETNQKRIAKRGTDKHVSFIDEIPNLTDSQAIVKANRLSLIAIDSSGSFASMQTIADRLIRDLKP